MEQETDKSELPFVYGALDDVILESSCKEGGSLSLLPLCAPAAFEINVRRRKEKERETTHAVMGRGWSKKKQKTLAKMARGETVDLRFKGIGDDGARAVADTLRVNGTVTKVFLSNNAIGNDGVRALGDAVRVNTTVTTLNLRDNSIGAEGARAVADALRVNATISILRLECNSIGADGVRALADGLKVNSTVTELNLYLNSIGDDGARAVADALRVNSTLTDVKLWHNSIGDGGARAVADAIRVNSTVTKLGLDGNKAISSELRDEIEALVKDIDGRMKSQARLKSLETKRAKKKITREGDKGTRSLKETHTHTQRGDTRVL
jgi:Ran GTPase-activating protein (RanGAP) involved in mRNA processing and transport